MRAWQLNGQGSENIFQTCLVSWRHISHISSELNFFIYAVPPSIRHIFSTVIDYHRVQLLIWFALLVWGLLSSGVRFLALRRFGSTEFGPVVYLTTPLTRVPMGRALSGDVVFSTIPAAWLLVDLLFQGLCLLTPIG